MLTSPARLVLVINGKPMRYSAYTLQNERLHVTRQITTTERRTDRYQVLSVSLVQPPLWLTNDIRRRRTQLRIQAEPLAREPGLPARLSPQRLLIQEDRPVQIQTDMRVVDVTLKRLLLESLQQRQALIIHLAAAGLRGAQAGMTMREGFFGEDQALCLPPQFDAPLLLARSNPSLFGPDPDGVWVFGVRGPNTPAPPVRRPAPPFPAIIAQAVEWYQALAYDAEQTGDLVRAEAWRKVGRDVAQMDAAAFARWYMTVDHPRSV